MMFISFAFHSIFVNENLRQKKKLWIKKNSFILIGFCLKVSCSRKFWRNFFYFQWTGRKKSHKIVVHSNQHPNEHWYDFGENLFCEILDLWENFIPMEVVSPLRHSKGKKFPLTENFPLMVFFERAVCG